MEAVRIVVGTTPVKIADQQDASGGHTLISNTGAVAVDLGGPGVLAGAGYALAGTTVLTPIVLAEGEQLFAVTASGTTTVQVLGPGAVQNPDPRSPGVRG